MTIRHLLRPCVALALLIVASGVGTPVRAQSDLILTGIVDGPLPGGTPKAIELYVVNDVGDLGVYGFGSANNGGGSDGIEYVLSGSGSAGDFLYVSFETDGFTDFFGFAPTFTAGPPANINGDDAIELFFDPNGLSVGDATATTSVVDTFGDINTDGTEQPWEYLDGWAYRASETGPDGGAFVLSNWTFSGANALDDETTNASASTPFPIGTYAPGENGAMARLQVIHNSPDPAASTVDVYVNGVLDLDDVDFREATPFRDVPAGMDLLVEVTLGDATDNSSPLFSSTYNLDGGQAYQLIATGVVGTGFSDNPDGISTALTLLLGTDAQEASGDDARVALRVVHGSPDAPTIDVRSGTLVLVDDASYTDITGYTSLPAAPYTLDVTTADGTMIVASSTADLRVAGGSAVTVLASGFLTPEDDNTGPAFALLAVFADGTALLLPPADPLAVVSIAEARTMDEGTTVTVKGVVTRAQGRLSFVQDATAALAVFSESGAYADAIAAGTVASGDSLRVTGVTGDSDGLFQLSGIESFEVISRGHPLPMAQSVTLEEIVANGEAYESELVQVRRLLLTGQGTFAASTTYQVRDPSGTATLRTPSPGDTRIVGVGIPQEAAIFRGVLGQFDRDAPRDSGYQLTPIAETDVVLQGDASALVVNEIHYDPASGADGDANGDGARDNADDEFIEIVNAGASSIDLGGFVIEDRASQSSDDAAFVRHRFPVGTVLEAGQAIVVFGGGTPTGDFGSSLVQTASGGGLGLNNDGDTIIIAEAAITLNAGGIIVTTLNFDGSVEGQSIARVPDLTGDFAAHTSNPQNPARFSPGVSNLTGGGGGFPSTSEETPDGALVLTVANPLRSHARVRFALPASGDVSLVLYDALGRQVAALAEGNRAAGEHSAALNAAALAPGVYVLRLVASGARLTQTLTVVR